MKWHHPDSYSLVLIDIIMPKMDGFQLYERLKKIDPDVNACFLTASEMYYGVNRGVEHCALNEDLFLQKPISTDNGSKQEDRLNIIVISEIMKFESVRLFY